MKAKRLLAALLRIGWTEDLTRRKASHRTLRREGYATYTFAFHDGEEIGSSMVAIVAKRTGLRPEDL